MNDAATAVSQWMHLAIPNEVTYGLAALPLYTWARRGAGVNRVSELFRQGLILWQVLSYAKEFAIGIRRGFLPRSGKGIGGKPSFVMTRTGT